MTNEQVAEKFAKLFTKGKSGTMFIEGDTVYSYGYHFPIARRLSNTEAVMTTDKYSQTTGRHVSLVQRALVEYNYNITYQSFKK